jgi:hypothetical protein
VTVRSLSAPASSSSTFHTIRTKANGESHQQDEFLKHLFLRELPMRRILIVIWVFVSAQAIASGQPQALGHTVRWDLIRIQQGTALVGGEDIAVHAASGDTFTLTGSGDAEPAERDASGGGTIVHHFAATNVDSAAVYLVTGFIDWQPGGGQLELADGIGHAAEASSGVLKMAIRIYLPSGAVRDATLTVNSQLPGSSLNLTEGIELTILGTPFVDMAPGGGATLFHVLK